MQKNMASLRMVSSYLWLMLVMTDYSDGLKHVRLNSAKRLIRNCVVQECFCIGNTMECNGKIPVYIPTGISRVKLENLKCEDGLSSDTFHNESWSKIMNLDISWQEIEQTSNKSLIIRNASFLTMKNLQYLGVHVLRCLVIMDQQIESGAFNGLENLFKLNVSYNERLSFNILSKILQTKTSFPRLQVFLMNGFGIEGYANIPINLNSSVMTALGRRNLTHLEANDNILNVLDVNPTNVIFNYLENLSLRNVQVYNLCYGKPRDETVYESLHTLDISSGRIPLSSVLPQEEKPQVTENKQRCKIDEYVIMLVLKRLQHLKTLIANDFHSEQRGTSLFNCTLTIPSSRFTFSLKNLTIQENKLRKIYFEIETNITFVLEHLDLRYNDLEYFDTPHLLINMISTLLLAHNNLHIMLETNPEKFTEMFTYLHNLQVVDISYNKLSYIPKALFKYNTHLREIYLSYNYLQQFYQTVVIPCRVIDLVKNDINVLNDNNIRWFERINDKSNGSMQLRIESNPLQCRCNSRKFVHWLLMSECFVHQRLKCQLDGVQVPINKDTYAKLQNDCNVNIKYIIISTLTIATLSVAFMAAKLGKRLLNRHNTKRKAKIVLTQLKNGCFKMNFLSFLIYSDRDSGIVLEHLYPLLTDTFKTNVGDIEGEGLKFVGIGDRHFRPGYGIMDEVNRCFNDTAVILAVVSNAFCESLFCKNELEYAIIVNKPVVLLFVDTISEESMPACVRQLFNKNVRVKIEMKEQEIKVTPHVDDVCSAIFSLAY